MKKCRFILWLGLISASFLGLSCASTDEKSDENIKTHYTLTLGKTKVHGEPLANETMIKVNWHHANGDVKTVDGFRGWDFDYDGRFEMIEVLSESGEPQTYVFDFDADGVIDAVQGDEAGPIDPVAVFAKAQALLADPAYAH
jgi:hypothetical protein